MTFNYDTTGVKEAGGNFDPIPEGTYLLRIGKCEVKKNKNGHPMVNVTLSVEDGPYAGRKLWNNVSFPPAGSPGAGMAKHWLHAIGQPYEGKVTVAPEEWTGLVKCEVVVGEFNGKPKNDIKEVYLPEEGGGTSAEAPGEQADGIEEVPF